MMSVCEVKETLRAPPFFLSRSLFGRFGSVHLLSIQVHIHRLPHFRCTPARVCIFVETKGHDDKIELHNA